MVVQANIVENLVVTKKDKNSYTFFTKYNMGTVLEQDILELSFFESLYLVEKNKLEIVVGKKILTREQIIKKFERKYKGFYTSYLVFKDLWSKGYLVKSGLKFGAEFRVYDTKNKIKGSAKHSKWICFPVFDHSTFNWFEFASKNRVAHSTKKRLLIAVVSSENHSITYYDIDWIKP